MSDNSLLKDSCAREMISKDIFTNFFVEAGAGSGKTYSLVDRMCNMIEAGIKVDKICAITFTNAAANEFYSRFHKKLMDRSRDSKLNGRVKVKIADALNNFDACFMGTIDSFCQLIISEHPNIVGIPSNAKVVDNDQLVNAYTKEFNNIINGLYNDFDPSLEKLVYDFTKLNDKYTQEIFATGIRAILDTRNYTHVKPDYEPVQDLDKKYRRMSKRLVEALNTINSNIDVNIYFSNNSNANNQQHIDNFNQAFNYIHILNSSLNDKPSLIEKALKNLSKIKLNLDFQYLEYYSDILEVAYSKKGKPRHIAFKQDILDSITRDIKDLRYHTNYNFFIKSFKIIEAKLKKEGIFSYFDFQYYLACALRESANSDSKLINYISSKHSYFLIDEFQDTNPIQSEIFFYLSAKKISRKWYKCQPRDGSLFIVGDPKQSIYRFRNADISSYLFVKKIFENGAGRVVELTKNWRSTAKLSSYFNKCFSAMLPHDTKTQRKYSLIPITTQDKKDSFVGLYKFNIVKEKIENNIQDEANAISKIINGLIDNNNFLLYDKKLQKNRKIKYSDFMIITFNTTKLKFYTDALIQNDIPIIVEGFIPFSECDILSFIFDILNFICFTDNNIFLYKILKSNIFSLSDKTIYEITKQNGVLTYEDLLNYKKGERVEKVIKALKNLIEQSKNLTVLSFIEYIVEYLELYKFFDYSNLECFYYAKELIRDSISSGKVVDLNDTCKYLSLLLDNSSDEKRCPSLSREDNKVKVANVHKVKGLEAPIVILAQPYVPRSRGSAYRVAQENGIAKCWFYGLNFQASNSFNEIDVLNTYRYKQESELESQCLKDEIKRLKYVAATRARDALIVADYIRSDGSSLNNNWGDLITDDFTNIFSIVDREHITEKDYKKINAEDIYKQNQDFNNILKGQNAQSYQIINPSKVDVDKDNNNFSTNIDNSDTLTSANKESVKLKNSKYDSTLCGTLVHRLMELIVTNSVYDYSYELVELALNENNAVEDVYKHILEKVYKKMLSGGYAQSSCSSMCDDLFAALKRSSEIYCELPFSYVESNKKNDCNLISGIIDLLYKDDAGWHIVDYKTNYEFIDLNKRYDKQLNLYRNAVKSNINVDVVDANIYHICV